MRYMRQSEVNKNHESHSYLTSPITTPILAVKTVYIQILSALSYALSNIMCTRASVCTGNAEVMSSPVALH